MTSATFSMMPELPSFFGKLNANMDERFQEAMAEGIRLRNKYNIAPAKDDPFGKRIAVFLIDFQRTFAATHLIPGPNPNFQLGVPGALDDAHRFSEWFLKNAHRIGKKYLTLDTHQGVQIFHPLYWSDDKGNYPPAFTIMSFKNGLIVGSDGKTYTANYNPLEAEAYIEALARDGKYALMIWPFHSMVGSLGHALIPELHEAIFFHDVLRQEQSHMQMKGRWLTSEAYSGIKEEVTEVTVGGRKKTIGSVYTELLKAVDDNDQVVFAGEASSHCVKATIEDLADMASRRDPAILKKFYILKDCMSPVPQAPGGPDFPALANKALADFAARGMNIVTTKDNFLL